jgi:putative nucleotidyltransferase with HDIG domain
MKKDDKNVVPANSTNVVSKKHLSYHTTIISFLPIVATLTAILPGVFSNTSGVSIVKLAVLTLILTTAASFFIRMNEESILNKKFAKTIITVSYVVAICLIMLTQHPETLSFWMIGGLVVSMLIDNRLGLLLHFNLTFILGIALSVRPEEIIYLLVIGILMSLLSSSLKQKSTIIYAAIILLSTNITLAFILNNFVYNSSLNYNYMGSFFSILAVLVTAFSLCFFYERFLVKEVSEADAELPEADTAVTEIKAEIDAIFSGIVSTVTKPDEIMKPEVTLMELNSEDDRDIVPIEKHFGTRTSYELLNEKDNALLIKLKEHSGSLYEHALRIGDLSYRAAKEIGADELLSKAGGLYHEIGKINSNNYIEEGIKIAEEYAFPKELIMILKQHNIKYEKPTSMEATIVMLSDNVVSTIEYIEKTGDNKFTSNKIIDNIFQMRMEKGTFDQSGLSIKDFKKLKDFYQKEFNTAN